MNAYFDSAIIVKLYVQQTNSTDAIRLAAGCTAPYALTQWQALEVRNAVRLKVFRREITSAEMQQSMAAFEHDVTTGRWQRPNYAAAAIEQKAEELSANHTATLGCRTLDLIHVAAALVIGSMEFITFDVRQAAVAKQAGLTVKPLI